MASEKGAPAPIRTASSGESDALISPCEGNISNVGTILGNAGQTSQSLALVVGDAALVEGGAELG